VFIARSRKKRNIGISSHSSAPLLLWCDLQQARSARKTTNKTMASRFGLSSSSSSASSMRVTNTPASDLALTNLAFCSPSDLRNFAVPGHNNLYLAAVADSFVLSLSYPSSPPFFFLSLQSILHFLSYLTIA